MDSRLGQIRSQLAEGADIKQSMVDSCSEGILEAADLINDAIRNGNKVLWCGNGGSAAQAQHLSTELLGGLRRHDLAPLPSVSLTTDSSLLTAWSNDVGFDTLFERQIKGLGSAGDVLIGLSTSGNSENVVKGVDTAEEKGLRVIVLTGRDGGKLAGRGDVCIRVPSDDTQRIQEGHLAAGHIFCELVELSFV